MEELIKGFIERSNEKYYKRSMADKSPTDLMNVCHCITNCPIYADRGVLLKYLVTLKTPQNVLNYLTTYMCPGLQFTIFWCLNYSSSKIILF